MGAITLNTTIHGKSLQEAFKQLQKDAREEYGDDAYNGEWNNCTGITEVSVSEYNKREKADDMSKHENGIAKCLRKPINNNMKVKTSVENYPVKGARKWITKYVVYNWDGMEVGISDKQADAIKKARAYVELNPNRPVSVDIEKRLDGGNTKVASIKYKKSTKEADGSWEIMGVVPY